MEFLLMQGRRGKMMGNRGNAEHFPGGVDPFLERRSEG